MTTRMRRRLRREASFQAISDETIASRLVKERLFERVSTIRLCSVAATVL